MAIANSSSTRTSSQSTTAAAPRLGTTAIAAMLAFNLCPAQAFQPSTFLTTPLQYRLHHNNHHPVSGLSMRGCSSPWNMDCYDMQPFQRPKRRGLMRSGGPTIFAPPGSSSFQDSPSSTTLVGEPEVTETEYDYKLTFAVPAEVDEENGLDISISGRLLTVRAQATREETSESGPAGRRVRGGRFGGGGGWFSRSSRTDTVARSVVIPEGVSVSGATTQTSSTSEGDKLEVRFKKLVTGERISTDNTTAAVADEGKQAARVSSASTNYLSSLSGPTTTTTSTADSKKVEPPKAPPTASAAAKEIPDSADADSPAPAGAESAPTGRRRPRSVLEALDKDFGEFARLMWGEENVPRFPTEEEIAAIVEAAREAQARRVMAMRRATMATDVSDTGGAYVVRMALPEGATRDDAKLTVSPDNTIRVSFSAKGRRSISKDVRLPRDALFSEISAKFRVDEMENSSGDKGEEGGEEREAAMGASVSALEISVGKVTPLEPKTIEIM